MIQVEGKAANKSLRIYRPDVTLEEICRSNGAAIVRKMIPCFNLPEEIINKKKGGNRFPGDKYPRYSFVYGVNARTPRVDKVLPFSTAYIFDKNEKFGTEKPGEDPKGVGRVINSLGINPDDIELKVPEFTDRYNIRELFLYADIKNGKISPKDVIILSLTTDKKLTTNKFNELKKDVCKARGFFVMQANALKIQERAYLWLTSEDYNVNTAGDALSNIIAISDDFDAIESHIKHHRLDFINLLFLIKARYMFDTEIAQRKTAIASAKAAIMSRNMSHNLGSHVMAYLKQHLNSVQDMVRDNVLDSIIKSNDDLSTKAGFQRWLDNFQKNQKGLSKVALPFLVGLGKFISYLQERQDFIATIATDYVPYFSSVSFKDGVYDELNPDLRYERHPERSGLEPDNILLGNIARSEGLARSTRPTKNKESQMSDIVLKYKDFTGKSFKDRFGKPYTVEQIPNLEQQKKDLAEMRDFMISLPGGVVGRQAIFSIVENVIRNAAKHGKWGNSSGKNLELTFKRYTWEEFKQGQITNDFAPKGDDSFLAFFEKYYAFASDINDLYVITLTDNMPFEVQGTRLAKCERLAAIRNALKEPYINNATVEMLQTNKGIKEMRISAAWMRGIEDDVKINPLYITPDFDFDKIPDEKRDKEDHWIQVAPKSPEEGKNFVYKYWDEDKKHWIGKAPVLMVRACADTKKEDYHLQYVFCVPKPKKVAIILPNKKYKTWISAQKELALKGWFSRHAWGFFSVDSFVTEKNKSYEFILISSGVSKSDIEKIQQLSPKRVYTQNKIKKILQINKSIFSKNFSGFESTYVSLYRLLSNFNAKRDFIVVCDGKVKKGKSVPANVTIDETASYECGTYLYKTHNDTEQNFTAFLKEADNKTDFVEGITGNNSTDRLIRNDKIDELWLYKHLHAMKTSVGIFDERIFSKIYKKDEADIRQAQLPFEQLREHIKASILASNLTLKRAVASAKTEEELQNAINQNPREVLGDYISIAYEKKGIGVFNILKAKNTMEIYGFGGYKWDESRKHYYSIIEKVGEITKISGLSPEEDSFKISNLGKVKYDYISIHQGLLDKIYEMFDIRNNPAAKHEFTKAFYLEFCKDSKFITYKDKMISTPTDKNGKEVYFLPNLRIHSGRSKPSFADMPQHQPFIQYAAIEHAVLDCKYSLIELLDFARYE